MALGVKVIAHPKITYCRGHCLAAKIYSEIPVDCMITSQEWTFVPIYFKELKFNIIGH